MLGLYPYAPLNLLLLDPHLPVWLPELSLGSLHVGAAVIDLRFWRTTNGDSDSEGGIRAVNDRRCGRRRRPVPIESPRRWRLRD